MRQGVQKARQRWGAGRRTSHGAWHMAAMSSAIMNATCMTGPLVCSMLNSYALGAGRASAARGADSRFRAGRTGQQQHLSPRTAPAQLNHLNRAEKPRSCAGCHRQCTLFQWFTTYVRSASVGTQGIQGRQRRCQLKIRGVHIAVSAQIMGIRPSFLPCLLVTRDLWMCGITPPPAMVALISVSNCA